MITIDDIRNDAKNDMKMWMTMLIISVILIAVLANIDKELDSPVTKMFAFIVLSVCVLSIISFMQNLSIYLKTYRVVNVLGSGIDFVFFMMNIVISMICSGLLIWQYTGTEY